MERIVARKLVHDLERRNVLFPNQRGHRAGKHTWKKSSQIRIRCLRRIREEGTNSGREGRSGRCVQQSAIQTADGTPCAIWRQLHAHKMARSSTPRKKGCHATKLDFHAPTTDNGVPQGSPVSNPLQCLHKGTCGSEQQWEGGGVEGAVGGGGGGGDTSSSHTYQASSITYYRQSRFLTVGMKQK